MDRPLGPTVTELPHLLQIEVSHLIVCHLMTEVVGAKRELMLTRIGGAEPRRLVMALLTTASVVDAACAELLSRHDLSEGRLAALMAVSDAPGVTPAQLADRLVVTRATVTGLVDGLERAGLVKRVSDPADRRSLALRATAKGEALIDALAPLYATRLEQVADGIAADHCEVALGVMAAMQRNVMQVAP